MNKKPNLFVIALRNIKAYGWMNAKLCFTFACLAFLICLFTIYNSALSRRYDAAVKERISSNFICTSSLSKYDAMKETENLSAVKEDSYRARLFRKEAFSLYEMTMEHLKTKFLTLEIDGKEYNAYSNMEVGCLSDPGEGYFTEYDLISFKALYGFDSPYLIGSRPLESGDVAISEAVFDAFDIRDAQSFVGKHVDCFLRPLEGSDKAPIKLFSANISGVIHAEIRKLSGHNIPSTIPGFLFSEDSPIFKEGTTRTYYRMMLSDWPDEETATVWAETYGGIYYGINSVKYVTGLKNIKTLGANLYFIIGCALFIALVLTLFLMIDKYTKIFSRFGGVLLTLGLKHKSLNSLLFLQLMILSVIAIPISFVLTYLGYKVITGVIMLVVNVTFEVTTLELLAMFAIGMVVVIAISSLLFLLMAFKLKRKTVKQLLVTVAD